MSKTIAIVVGLVLLVSLLLYSMTYTVNFHEVAIKTRFGQTTPDSIVREPGLKFRLPLFADKVTTFDTRLQVRESVLDSIQTSDGQQVVVRAFLMWNVDTEGEGPLKFFRSFASVDAANQLLLDQFPNGIAVRPNDHEALHRRVVSQFGFADDIEIPLREVDRLLGNFRNERFVLIRFRGHGLLSFFLRYEP